MGVGQDMRLTLRPGSGLPARGVRRVSSHDRPVHTGASHRPRAAQSRANHRADYDRDQLGVGTRVQLSTPGLCSASASATASTGTYFEGDTFKDEQQRQPHDLERHELGVPAEDGVVLERFGAAVQVTRTTPPRTPRIVSRVRQHEHPEQDRHQRRADVALGFTIAGGYGAGFLRNNNDYESVIAQVEARWRFTRDRDVGARLRSRVQSVVPGRLRAHRPHQDSLAVVARRARLILTLRAELSWIDFGEDPVLMQTRNDLHLLTDLMLEYRIVSWFAITGEVGLHPELHRLRVTCRATGTRLHGSGEVPPVPGVLRRARVPVAGARMKRHGPASHCPGLWLLFACAQSSRPPATVAPAVEPDLTLGAG